MLRQVLALGLAALTVLAVPAAGQEAEPLRGVQIKGDPDAPVHVIEYVSLTCPHCATWHAEVFPAIDKDYVETGKVRFELREVYFDRFGLWAAMLARCGGESRYFGFIDLLLDEQEAWTRADDIPQALFRVGRKGGLSDDRIEACFADEAFQKDLVGMYQEYYEDPLLTGTPTLIVEGEKIEAPSVENMTAAIEAALD